jgi:dodecin
VDNVDKNGGAWKDERAHARPTEGGTMPDSVYKVIEVIGTSPTSFAEAAKSAVEKVASTVQDLRVARVVEFDMKLENGKVTAYRARVKVSFKYHDEL